MNTAWHGKLTWYQGTYILKAQLIKEISYKKNDTKIPAAQNIQNSVNYYKIVSTNIVVLCVLYLTIFWIDCVAFDFQFLLMHTHVTGHSHTLSTPTPFTLKRTITKDVFILFRCAFEKQFLENPWLKSTAVIIWVTCWKTIMNRN